MFDRIRTDLALELKDKHIDKNKCDGIVVKECIVEGNIKETTINILDDETSKIIGKPIGKYITLENKSLSKDDISINENFVNGLWRNLKELVGNANNILVVGLGNRNVTPDALGPLVIDNLYVTRHIHDDICKTKAISAIAPGILEQTGIESQSYIKAICDEINPNLVIVIDALAAMEPGRINTTIQISDTGICPGSGVGNNRVRIDENTIGVKVIAIGVPTVISEISIIGRYIDLFIDKNKLDDNGLYFDFDDLDNLCKVFVTPQNIDLAIKRISYTISEAINKLL